MRLAAYAVAMGVAVLACGLAQPSYLAMSAGTLLAACGVTQLVDQLMGGGRRG